MKRGILANTLAVGVLVFACLVAERAEACGETNAALDTIHLGLDCGRNLENQRGNFGTETCLAGAGTFELAWLFCRSAASVES